MRIYARFSEQGDPLGYYSDLTHGARDIEGTKIPLDAVEITLAQHKDLIDNRGRRRFIDGNLVSYEPPPFVPPIPAITKTQALLYLLSLGKYESDVVAIIDAIPDPVEREKARIEWTYPRNVWTHDHPLFVTLGPAIGIEDMEQAFRGAARL